MKLKISTLLFIITIGLLVVFMYLLGMTMPSSDWQSKTEVFKGSKKGITEIKINQFSQLEIEYDSLATEVSYEMQDRRFSEEVMKGIITQSGSTLVFENKMGNGYFNLTTIRIPASVHTISAEESIIGFFNEDKEKNIFANKTLILKNSSLNINSRYSDQNSNLKTLILNNLNLQLEGSNIYAGVGTQIQNTTFSLQSSNLDFLNSNSDFSSNKIILSDDNCSINAKISQLKSFQIQE